jgi:hypothetical protein
MQPPRLAPGSRRLAFSRLLPMLRLRASRNGTPCRVVSALPVWPLRTFMYWTSQTRTGRGGTGAC